MKLMNRLWVRMSLAFSLAVAISMILVAMTGLIINRHERLGDFFLDRYQLPGTLIAQLVDYYRQRRGWEGVDTILAARESELPRVPGRGLALVLADADGRIVYGTPSNTDALPGPQDNSMAIVWGGQIIGYIQLNRVPVSPPPDPPAGFLQQQIGSLVVIVSVIGGLTSIIAGIVVTRSLTAPLSHLAQTAREFGAKNMDKRANLKGGVEITEVAKAFNEMADALQKNEQQRRNMVADIAHELRTPLAVLKSNLEALQDGVFQLTNEELQVLIDQTELLSHLVSDLHDLAQAEARQLHLDTEVLDFSSVVSRTAEKFAPSAKTHDITLQIRLLPDPLPVEGDWKRLDQVMNNLLTNALQHTPPGGTIQIWQQRDGEWARLMIQDTGSGIAPEHLPHVFERFYRIDPSRSRETGGAGLGLAIVKAIVEMHNGSVEAHSDGVPGSGTRITVSLPLAKSAGQPAPATSS